MAKHEAKELLALYKHFQNGRRAKEDVWRLLDAYDRGNFWKTLKAKLPPYQILPETNYVSYIKQNTVNSIYTGAYRADIMPRTPDDIELCRQLNAFMEFQFDRMNMPYYQLKAGDRTALLNVGAVQFGWNNDIVDGVKNLHKGEIEPKSIDIMSLYLDPGVADPYRGRAMITADEVSISELKGESRFKDAIERWEENHKDYTMAVEPGYIGKHQPTSADKVVRLLTIFIRSGKTIDQVWMLDDGTILAEKEDIGISQFPIALLYAEPPVDDAYGTPNTYKVLSNILTINMIDSIEATYAYASINRTKIINTASGIDVNAFAKFGNHPDKLFQVNGDPNAVVRYVELPQLYGNLPQLRDRLADSIFLVTGIDLRYTGRDTGSVTTTGGMDLMQQRISMTDNTKIAMLEQFAKKVTELVLEFYITFGEKRDIPEKNNLGELIEVNELDFTALKDKRFDFTVHAAPHLPKNRARLAEAANMLMEKQMQYQSNPPIITQEEWLLWQDFPQKQLMIDRMKADRNKDDLTEVMSDISSFSGMVSQGLDPQAAAGVLADEKSMRRQNPKLGNVGNANSFQMKQMG